MTGLREQGDFQSALARLLSERRRYAVRGTLSILLAAALAAVSILLTVAFRFGGSRFFPLFAFILFWLAVGAAATLAALRELRPLGGARGLAALIDGRAGSGNLVTAAYEFANGGERIRAYSPYLVGATIGRARERLRSLDPRVLFADSGAPAWTAAGILFGLLVAVQVAFLHGEPGRIFAAIADPALAFRSPRGYNLVVTSGDRFVLPGESVTAEAVNFGAGRGAADLLVSAIPGVWNTIKVRGEAGGAGAVRMTVYRHPFGGVRDDFRYAFSAGGARTRDYRVTVMHRPVVNGVTAVVKHPPYTQAAPDTIAPLAGKIVALSGSKVELAGETSVPIRGGVLRFSSGAEVALEARAGGFAGAFTVAANDTFEIAIVDSMGLANDRAVKHAVVALEDRAPSIELLAPEDRAQLPRTLIAELLYRASDDYGIARVELEFLREGKDETFKKVPLPLAPGGAPAAPGQPGAGGGGAPTDLAGRSEWSLADEGVLPGDRILYYLEAFDNNVVTGPGRARTETRTLVVPSTAEIYARIREEEAKQRENLEDVYERGKEIKERLQKLSDELKAEGELDWSRKRESGEILEKQRELREKMRDITSRIDKGLDDVEKNRTASQEVGEKIEQIQNLLKQIENEELRNLIEKFQKLMGEVSSKDLMAAMNEVQLDTDKLIQSMDRTIELLKQVIREGKMDEFAKRLDEMLKDQSAIRDSTPRGDTDELSKRQDELGKESGSYRKDMEKFASEESDSSLASELEKLLQEMKEKAIEEQMKQAAEELSSGDRSSAQCSQSKAMEGLLSLYTSLGRCQMSMGMALEREVAERLARSARELVEVSKLQETLEPRLGEPFGRSNSERLLKDELVVKDALEKIADNLVQVGRRTMLLTTKVFVVLGMAQKNVEAVLKGIEDEQPAAAAAASGAAYRTINLAVIELLRSMSSSGGSRPSARQMMQQLMQQQLSLGEELRRLLQGGSAGRWSMEERATMARLAAEQRKMEELVKQIAEESAGTGELMGNLDDVAKQMEQMAKELEKGTLTDDLVRRQEHILTRMLDSQRSMRERDYKRERSSTAAGEVAPLAPDAWNEGTNRSDVLLRMIRKAMQERGPAEYEELVRQYFRALSEKVREDK